ncbi:hypothetical protein BGZ57DRAFT_916151 [Hyaloscypha finlandica]|nr:hypothetical protein BGZ57DRAFT_916151 [Hyaloscypha finlandica]KAH8771207.1 hypothetical protein F5882DRAFT_411179 [Hyaloscypha sp. PMI_1271]
MTWLTLTRTSGSVCQYFRVVVVLLLVTSTGRQKGPRCLLTSTLVRLHTLSADNLLLVYCCTYLLQTQLLGQRYISQL